MRSGLIKLAPLALLVLAGDLFAQPAVSHVSPGGVPPGQKVELTLHGSKLNDPLQIWTSFPATVELQPADPNQKEPSSRKIAITVDASVAPGIGGVMVGNPNGASDVAFVVIDDLASVADSGKNHSAQASQAVALPIAVDGVADGAQYDFYKFSAKKGQRVAAEVLSARLGGAFDPVLRLLKADGQELVMVDDDPSLGADCRFEHTFAEDGEYLLEIHDNQYRAGGRYRLRIGDFPLVTAPFPLGGRVGSTARFEFTGSSSSTPMPVFLRVPDSAESGELTIGAKLPEGKSSAIARLAVSDLPERMEAEPNDAFKVATEVTLPSALNGIFEKAGDKDYFTFPATKGQTFSFRTYSRSLGSPSFAFLRILDANEKQLAVSSVGNAEELTLTYTFPADGMYGLMARDLLHRGGSEHAYRIEADLRPGFTLALKNDKNSTLKYKLAEQNGAFAIPVQIGRQGYDGEIELFLDGSSGLRLINPRVPAKAKEHRLIVAVLDSAKPGDLKFLGLAGRPASGGSAVPMSTFGVVRAKRPHLLFPPRWMDGVVSVSTATKADPFFAFKPSVEEIAYSAENGQAQFTLALERKNGEFKAAVTVTLEELPEGFSYSVKPDKDNYQVTITGPKQPMPGKHQIRVVSFGEFKGSGQIASNQLVLQ